MKSTETLRNDAITVYKALKKNDIIDVGETSELDIQIILGADEQDQLNELVNLTFHYNHNEIELVAKYVMDIIEGRTALGDSDEDKAENIVDSIEDDISGRSGIGDEWGQIDDDTKTEIRQAWKDLILKHLE